MFCPECGTWNRAAAPKCGRCEAALPELETPGEKPDEEISVLRHATGNRYRIMKRLGSGGMAHVYHGEHALLRRPVAIKVLLGMLAREEEMRVRFRREAEAASQLVHPHIVPIYDYGEIEGVVYLVMPYLAGGSLADQLGTTVTITPTVSASVAAQICGALDYAHRRGVVHRDVKPDNVLFDEEGNAQLTDFGIAAARFFGRLTGTGRTMGTPHYMSPEQAMGKIIDGRSDLYAVGVMLYEMLLGFTPFDGADSYSIGYKHVHEQAAHPDVVDSRVPPALSQIVMKCLAKKPEDRYQRGYDLADALLGFLRAHDTTSGERRAALLSRLPGLQPTPK